MDLRFSVFNLAPVLFNAVFFSQLNISITHHSHKITCLKSFIMQFTTLIITASALFLAPGALAWTTDAQGNWVANNNRYNIRGGKLPNPAALYAKSQDHNNKLIMELPVQ
jgi:hypothetical protein